MQEPDEYDKKLLSLLQQNNRLTAEELSERVHLSASAVQRRLKRLRDDKIIQADVSIVSPLAAGLRITCIVDIILQDGGSGELAKFKALMRGCDEVMQCYFVTGTYDFVLLVNVRDMEHYEAFSTKYLMDNPNVKHFHTHVVMDKVKVGYTIKF
ncbi:Lrp/AsnC family transcriptional regulator [Pedobacter sp. SYP-B3415]|uniref:Lrp/AsnC family transcriptional regulator n=1 Tax=Pedobacter sp. SYP-B3415 TaxID=2496641 RepID=UPI00101BEFAD|nr:Lrp/AsnC family transcriptional regulator [Pedobacter sp. SYP-B3415]